MAGEAGQPVGAEAERDAGQESPLRARAEPAAQRVGGERGRDERRAHDRVRRRHAAEQRAERDEQHAVEERERVEGEADPYRIEDVVRPQGIRMQVDEGLAHPPEVPEVDARVAPALSDVVGEEEIGQRPGEERRQRDVDEGGEPAARHRGRADVRRKRSQSTATAASLPR